MWGSINYVAQLPVLMASTVFHENSLHHIFEFWSSQALSLNVVFTFGNSAHLRDYASLFYLTIG